MQAAIDETNRRRAVQMAHNEKHGIVPRTVTREVTESITSLQESIRAASHANRKRKPKPDMNKRERTQLVAHLRGQMEAAAASYDFERAIELREELKALGED
jgi:excinuclease ABC subunit B